MNKFVNTFLLTGDNFMTELHLRQQDNRLLNIVKGFENSKKQVI